MSSKRAILGLDIGGTSTKFALVDADTLEVLMLIDELPTPSKVTSPAALEPRRLKATLDHFFYDVSMRLGRLRQAADQEGFSVVAVGVSLPGPIEHRPVDDQLAAQFPERLRAVVFPNETEIVIGLDSFDLADACVETEGFPQFAPQSELQRRLDLPVWANHDGACIARAEGAVGAAKGSPNYAVVIVGTGVGVAMVRDGQLLLNPDGSTPEIDMIVEPTSGLTVDELASAPALTRKFGSGVDSVTVDLKVRQAAKALAPTLVELFNDHGLTASRRPSTLVLAGGFAEDEVTGPALVEALSRELEEAGLHLADGVAIATAGRSAGFIGSAAFAQEGLAMATGFSSLGAVAAFN